MSKLRFPTSKLPGMARSYCDSNPYPKLEEALLSLRPVIRKRGWLTQCELFDIALWKSPRSSGHAKKNSEEFIKEITSFAFSTPCERARIESLTLLDGVSWPTASVILHLFHTDLYPILDFRALWSLRLEVPSQYDFPFWWAYVESCRDLARNACVDMRALDRALWWYSKKNQRT